MRHPIRKSTTDLESPLRSLSFQVSPRFIDDLIENGTERPTQSRNQGNTRSATLTPEFQSACNNVDGVNSPRAILFTNSIKMIVMPRKASRAANRSDLTADAGFDSRVDDSNSSGEVSNLKVIPTYSVQRLCSPIVCLRHLDVAILWTEVL
jgi:hypothetical protein